MVLQFAMQDQQSLLKYIVVLMSYIDGALQPVLNATQTNNEIDTESYEIPA